MYLKFIFKIKYIDEETVTIYKLLQKFDSTVKLFVFVICQYM